jgi:hypothetical protein
MNFIWTTFACEEIAMINETITIKLDVLWLHRLRTFNAVDVRKVRVQEQRYRMKGGERVHRQIAFDYRGDVIVTASNLSPDEATYIVGVLRSANKWRAEGVEVEVSKAVELVDNPDDSVARGST